MLQLVTTLLLGMTLKYEIPAEEPYSWSELHATAYRDAGEFKNMVKDYYERFPCDDCREHFQQMTDDMQTWFPQESITTRDEAQIWAWLAHNHVNLRLEKKWFPLNCLRLYGDSMSDRGLLGRDMPVSFPQVFT
jgi:hypothetical protein